MADGMAVIIRDGVDFDAGNYPSDFPACHGDGYELFDVGAAAAKQPACECLVDPETILEASPEEDWRCSTTTLCRASTVGTHGKEGTMSDEQVGGERVRGVPQGRNWTRQGWTIVIALLGAISILVFIFKCAPSMPKRGDPKFIATTPFRRLLKVMVAEEISMRMTPVLAAQVILLAVAGGLICEYLYLLHRTQICACAGGLA